MQLTSLTPAKVFGLLLPLISVIAGCAATPMQESQCDYEGPSGICVYIAPDAKTVNPEALEAAYVQAKREAEARYGFDLQHVRGPVVHVVSLNTFAARHHVFARMDGDKGGEHGWTDFGSGHITITGEAIMRHESFHYVLLKAGFSHKLNAAHDHPAFDEYRDGQWLPKRANR
jgi:hypothetical protein